MERLSSRVSLLSESALCGALLLAFFWLITRFIEAIYTFGLLGVDIPPEIASAALFLSPLLLVIVPGLLAPQRAALTARVIAAAALLCLAASLFLATRERMLVTGLGTSLMLLWLPSALAARSFRAAGFGGGLVLAGIASILFRAAYHGSDLLPGPASTAINLLVAAGGLMLLAITPPAGPAPAAAVKAGGLWRGVGRYLGLAAALLLLYFGFNAPAVIARWSGASYAGVTAALFGPLVLFGAAWFTNPSLRERLTPRVLAAWSGLFLAALVLALLPHQIALPASPAGYPIEAPAAGLLTLAALALALLLHPVIYAAAACLASSLMDEPLRPREAGLAALLGALFMLIMIFAHVFTTVYDYIPVVGPVFRDRFWLVTAFPALVMALAVWGAAPTAPDARRVHLALPAALGLAFAAVVGVTLFVGQAAASPSGSTVLRVMTYNIQQGYDTAGERAYGEQLAVIRAQDPDILGLQESDTARIANGNGDVVRYLSDWLGMHAYYGPTSVTGTFGIALLSRYPLENPRTFFMYSEGEQTAAILATIRVGGEAYSVLVTHLGNGGPLIQQQQVLEILAGQTNVIAMGDFNFRPPTEQYQLTAAAYRDAWEIAAEQAAVPSDMNIERRIDHVFVSPGLAVRRAAYLPEGPSDHPALVVEIAPASSGQ